MTDKKTTTEKKPVCFVLMPIADSAGYEPGHFGRVYEHLLKPAILAAGYEPVRADDTVKTDYIVVGIIQKIVESAMVVCDFSSRNPNVMYELGIRHAFNKPVVLIKDRKTEKIFDIQGLRYAEYDETLRIDAVNKDISKITSAISETANGGTEGMNSIVQLAGIKTAEVPVTQTISGDTKLILNALGALDARIQIVETRGERKNTIGARSSSFTQNGTYTFRDGSEAVSGETVFNDGSAVGRLVEWDASRQVIIIQTPDNEFRVMNLGSSAGAKVSAIPF